jgi:predicted TIM-barrel fold metal-dependent hydrolase
MTKWPMALPRGAVDALAYAGNWPHWPVPDSDEVGLLERMDRLSMRTVLLLSLATIYGDALAGNDRLAGLVRRHPGRLVACVTYDPRRWLPPEQVMDQGRESGLCSLALFPMHHGYDLSQNPSVQDALTLAADWNWPVVIPVRLVMNWSLPSTPLRTIVQVARQYPQTRILVAGTHYGEIDSLLSAMEELPNLYADTSCNQGAGALAELVTRGDPARIMLGTGQPIQIPECNLVKLLSEELDEETKEAVLWGNAARFFSL